MAPGRSDRTRRQDSALRWRGIARVTWVLVALALSCAIATMAGAERGRSRCPGAEVNLNLVDADLPEVLALISKATGRRFIVTAGVTATKLTIISPQPVCPAEAYEAFLSALAAQGLTVVQRGRSRLVLPVAQAVRGPVPLVVEHQ